MKDILLDLISIPRVRGYFVVKQTRTPKTEEKIVASQTPVRYMAVESCDEVRRNVFCLHYGECLNLTIRNRWPGFSCQDCESYEQEKLVGEALNEDHARCMALAFVSGLLDPMAHGALAS